MRIAQLIESLETGGAEKLAVDLANELVARGHQSHLIVLKNGGPFRARVSADVQFHDLARPRQDGRSLARLGYFAGTARRLTALLRHEGVEVLQTHLPKANFLGLMVGLQQVCRVYPTVHNNREFDYSEAASPLRTYLRKRAYRQMLDSCQTMIAVSEQVRQGMECELGLTAGVTERMAVVTNGVPVGPLPGAARRTRAREERGIKTDEFLIVGLGRLTRQKGFASLLQALTEWEEPSRPWRCRIAGEGELRPELETMVRRLRLTDRVDLPGHEPDVAGLLAAADVFCLPSLYEGLPLALLEAMGAGLPVCSYAINGVSELVTDGCEGLLAPSQNSTALGRNLRRLADETDLCRSFGEAGRQLVMRKFSFQRVVDQLQELYQA